MNSYTNALLRRVPLAMALAALAAFALAVGAFPASPVAGSQPSVTYVSVRDGDVFSEPVAFIQLCFAEPIDTTDLGAGGDFRFELLSPLIPLGLQIVFQPNGYGVAIHPGLAPGDTSGEWTFKYRVTSPDTHEALEGTVKYRVDPSGQPVPKASPLACLEGGATQSSGSGATATPTARPSSTKSPGPSGSGTPGPTVSGSGGDNDYGTPGILLLALLTVGVAGSAALIAIIGFAVRKRVGYEPHAPHEGEEPAEHP